MSENSSLSVSDRKRKIIQSKRRNNNVCIYCGKHPLGVDHECQEDYSYVIFPKKNKKLESLGSSELSEVSNDIVTSDVRKIFESNESKEESSVNVSNTYDIEYFGKTNEENDENTNKCIGNVCSNSVPDSKNKEVKEYTISKKPSIIEGNVNYFDVICNKSKEFNKYHVIFVDGIIVPFNVVYPLSNFVFNEPRIVCITSKLYYTNTNFVRAFRRVDHTYVVEKMINFEYLLELANDNRCHLVFLLTNNMENAAIFLKALEELLFAGFSKDVVVSKFHLVFENMFTSLTSQRFNQFNIVNVNPNHNQYALMAYLNIVRQKT